MNYLSNEKRNIKLLIDDMSKVLNVSVDDINFIEEYLNRILLNSKECSLRDILERYQDLFIKEMGNILAQKMTPSIVAGIRLFTDVDKKNGIDIIGYRGKNKVGPDAKDVDENTLYSLDSISKVITTVITMMLAKEGKIELDKPVNSYNKDFALDATPEEIMRFTASISTEKRIDNLSNEETLEILKKCRNDLEKVNNTPNFFQYSDIGYMILRLSLPDFLDRLDTLIHIIGEDDLTYRPLDNKDRITGGKKGEEYITPDRKGRDILFPGHSGLYANIKGLLNMYSQVLYTNNFINDEQLAWLCKPPYADPHLLNPDGTIKRGDNFDYYIAKAGGFYFNPSNVYDMNKMKNADIPTFTTNSAKASAGTSGSYVMGDDLSYNGKFSAYVAGILTNPYSVIEPGYYPLKRNDIENTDLSVTQAGVIFGYSGKLNPYKELIAKWGIVGQLLIEYAKNNPNLKDQLNNCNISPKKI